MSLLDTTGKTYTPVRWLPGVRRTDRVRPQATLREDSITIALGLWTLVSLFWDGIVHNNEVGIDSFFTAAHTAMYAGLIALGVWIGIVMTRYQDDMSALDFSAIPRGYGLAVVALPLAADRRSGRLHVAQRVRLREPDRLRLQPAASGPVPLRRAARRDPRLRRPGTAAIARRRCERCCRRSSP